MFTYFISKIIFSFFDILGNYSSSGQKSLFYIQSSLSRSLEKQNVVLLCKLLSFFEAYFSPIYLLESLVSIYAIDLLILKIYFVAHDYNCHLGVSVLFHFFKPSD